MTKKQRKQKEKKQYDTIEGGGSFFGSRLSASGSEPLDRARAVTLSIYIYVDRS